MTAVSPIQHSGSPAGVQLDIKRTRQERDEDLKGVEAYRRLANYIAGAQIFLKENVRMKEKLKPEHIKDRLLGHWGTCPGITHVYAHCNLLLRKHDDITMFLVVGPGHGAPAVLASLWIEGALEKYYPDYGVSNEGFKNLVKYFSWPGGFPSHVNAETPGAIHEGGELGYALAVSYGAVMDNPDLIVSCIVGDGESETGPTATAWHSHKFIDPKESGAVLPILHLNGFKIASPTVYGCMTDEELVSLFMGYGYQVRIMEDMSDPDADMAASMEWAYERIRHIQKSARTGQPIDRPYWPLIIMRTPKGWTGPKELHGKQIEGSFRSHQVPLPEVRTDEESRQKLEEWLHSYKMNELFTEDGQLSELVKRSLPAPTRRMGTHPLANPGFEPLDLPPTKDCSVPKQKKDERESPTMAMGEYLARVVERNPTRFRLFSPDELESNKLTGVLRVTTRNIQWAPGMAHKGGRVIEYLSEHNCQGWMQGYALTGRFAVFPSYETFLGIITTMMIQYGKFLKMAQETSWRKPVPAINYIESSTLWRQEHNGYSHQNPMFLNNLVNLKVDMVRVFFPPDANTALVVMRRCLESKNRINLVVSTKAPMPTFFNAQEAEQQVESGVNVWKWLSTEDGLSPDVVLVGCGNETNQEVVEAAKMLRADCPDLRIRVINVIDLMMLDINRRSVHSLTEVEFDALFTPERPVIFNFHGYPSVIFQLLFGRTRTRRFTILGYMEEGTTTTPFRMLTMNRVSRFHVCIQALRNACAINEKVALVAPGLIRKYKTAIKDHKEYIVKYGKDPENLTP